MQFVQGPTGENTQIRHIRGYWVGPDRDAGFGLRLPTDLRSVGDDADVHYEEWGIWYSPHLRRYYAITYEPRNYDWSGIRLKARSAHAAQEELANVMREANDAVAYDQYKDVVTN